MVPELYYIYLLLYHNLRIKLSFYPRDSFDNLYLLGVA